MFLIKAGMESSSCTFDADSYMTSDQLYNQLCSADIMTQHLCYDTKWESVFTLC